MYKTWSILIGIILLSVYLLAQSPSTNFAPVQPSNVFWTNGVGPGYYPTQGSGLTLNVSPGTVDCNNVEVDYTGGTQAMTDNTTNYVMLDPDNNCAVLTNTTGFKAGSYWIAKVVTSGGNITVLTNRRTMGAAITRITVPSILNTCQIVFGTDDGAASVLTNAQIAPQPQRCFIPATAVVVEVEVAADAGTPNIVVSKQSPGGSITDLLSSAQATGSAGAVACANTGGTLGLDGVTTCSNKLSVTAVAAGFWLGTHSGTAGGTARRFSVIITYSM